MRILDRYIRNAVLMALGLVLLILGGLDLIFTVFEELGDTGEHYSIGDALSYVLHTMPRHIYELLPMSSLLGALVGLGFLASSNELVVMQAAGIRVGRIVWSVMKPTALVMLLGLLLGEFVAPALELRGELHKALARGQQTLVSNEGYWLREGRQYLHANAIEPGGMLYGVTVREYDESRQPRRYLVAQRAVHEPEADQWRLEDVQETRFSGTGETLVSEQQSHEALGLPLDASPELLEILMVDADKMAISDLWRFARHFERQGQDADEYFLGFWKKLLQPLITGVLVLVAISFIFGPLRSATTGSRIFVAICFGLLFLIVQRLLNTVSLVYQLDPLTAVLLPVLASAAIGLVLLRRAA